MPKIGVISDTHGLLRLEAKNALAGVDLIIHAGDVGKPAILDELRAIAPVVAIRGNVDRAGWAASLPKNELVDIAGCSIYLLHDIQELDLNPQTAGIHIIIYGHSHQPELETKAGILYLNPGSAGPRRFKLPVTLAYLFITENSSYNAEIVTLPV